MKMKTKDFYFDLPEELIAQKPPETRGADRLLCLNRRVFSNWLSERNGMFNPGDFSSSNPPPGIGNFLFSSLPDLIPENTLMVFNDSRVRKARIYGFSEEKGTQAEFLLVSPFFLQGKDSGTVWKVMAKRAKRRKAGQRFVFPGNVIGTVIESPALDGSEFKLLEFDTVVDDSWLDVNGHVPLPPYIRREDSTEDSLRYQTVYARETGSMAAPTAGLHFTDEIISRLDKKGISRAYVTLHVGLGTFLPVRTDNIEEHHMHEECFSIPQNTAELVTEAKRGGRPVLAVGTTSIRTLESAWDETDGRLIPGHSSTSIFIYPGYKFKVVDYVFTNFHTPESTLLMLVSAFAGKGEILSTYKYAVHERYRFFSYGDSMLML